MSHPWYRVARAIVWVCAPLFILLSNLYVVATPAFIRFEYTRRVPLPDPYDQPERLSLANATLHYLRSAEPESYLQTLSVRGRTVYNEREVGHLVDVKNVMWRAFLVHGIAGLLLLFAFAAAWRSQAQRHGMIRAVAQGCMGFLALVVTLTLFAYFNFQTFFTLFHRLFFEGDTWLFSPFDTLIQLFPLQFWVDATFAIILLALAEMVMAIAALHLITRRGMAQ